MKLPNGDKAIVSDRKLFAYILNPNHEEGRHHARLFKSLLGIDQKNGEILRIELLRAAREDDAILGKQSRYGQKFEVRFQMTGKRGRYYCTQCVVRAGGRCGAASGHSVYRVRWQCPTKSLNSTSSLW